MHDASGHHYRKRAVTWEKAGPYPDPTAREAIRNIKTRGEEGQIAREAFGELMKVCREHSKKAVGADTLVVKAAMRLYRVVDGEGG